MARRLVSCHACGDDVEDPVVVTTEGESYYLCQYCFRHGRDVTVRNRENLRKALSTHWEYELVGFGLFCLVSLVVFAAGIYLWSK
jgi:hypothetical protein